MPASDDGHGTSTADLAQELLADCLAEAEADLEAAVDKLCAEHPKSADAIREQIEATRTSGLNRPKRSDDSWEGRTGEKAPAGAKDFEPIGPYQPLTELGRGGQGLVYLAEDVRLHRVVALKILKGFGPLSEKMMTRFRREAEVASKLDHSGICAVYDAGMLEGIPYIAMRYVEGTSLGERIGQARRDSQAGGQTMVASVVDPTRDEEDATETETPSGQSLTTRDDVIQVVGIIEKAARALHAAHEAGIIHRDVKPGNIMVPPTGEPVVLDFGLASEEALELSLTQTGDLFGTPAYMSPEQLMAQRIRLDRRTDVYSLAVTLFEAVTLKRPFESPTREGMYQAIQYKEAPDPRKLNPGIPVDLKVVLEKALEKDRDRRYATAEEFAEDLRRIRENEPIAARPVSAAGRVLRWAKRRPARAALVAALVIGVPVVTGLSGYAFAKQPEIEAARLKELLDRVEGHLVEGFSELAHGEPKDAVASFDLALGLKPDSIEAVGGKALALYRAEDYPSCLEFLDRHRSMQQTMPALVQLRADTLDELGREGEAADQRKNTAEPRTALGCFLEGTRLLRGCQKQKDKQVFRRALNAFTRATLLATHARPLYHFQLGHAAHHLGEEGPTQQVSQALLAQWPDSYQAARWAGLALRPLDLPRAIDALKRAVRLRPDWAPAHRRLGSALLDNGQLEEAIAVCEKAIELDPNGAAYGNLGRALIAKNRPGEAIDAYNKAIELEPTKARHHHGLGRAFHHQGQLAKAIEAYRKAIELDADFALAHDNLGRALSKAGHWEEAIEHLRTAITLNPGSAGSYLQLGAILCDYKRDYDGAIKLFYKAIELQQDNAAAYHNLGLVRGRQGKLDEAIDAYHTAVRLKPDSARSWHNLGAKLRQQGEPDEAIDAYRMAIKYRPRHAASHTNLGSLLCDEKGDYDGAIAEFRAAIELKPNHPTAYYNYGEALLHKCDFEGAIGRFNDALQRKPRRLVVSLASVGLWQSHEMLRVEPRFEEVTRGAVPEDGREAAALARIAYYKKRYVASVRLWQSALSPNGLEARDRNHDRWDAVFLAAGSAALAGAGKGKDAGESGDVDRADWRRQALEWMNEAVMAWEEQLNDRKATKSYLAHTLRVTRMIRDLASIRDEGATSKLSPRERMSIMNLWTAVDDLLERVTK